MRALASLDAPGTVLLLAGAGDSSALNALIQSLGMEGRVFVLVIEAMSRSSWQPPISTSIQHWRESFAMTILEAMAMEVPVLSTRLVSRRRSSSKGCQASCDGLH